MGSIEGMPRAWSRASVSGFVLAGLAATVVCAGWFVPVGRSATGALAEGRPASVSVAARTRVGGASGSAGPRIPIVQHGGFGLVLRPGVAELRPVRRLATTSGTIAADGSPVEVDVTAAGDTGTLTFTGSAGERVFVKAAWGTLTGGSTPSGTVALVAPDGSTVGSNFNCSGCTGFIDATALPSSGTYTLKVTLSAGATGSVTLTMWDVPADASASIAADGTPVTVNTTVPGQNGLLSFSGTAGERVFVLGSLRTGAGAR